MIGINRGFTEKLRLPKFIPCYPAFLPEHKLLKFQAVLFLSIEMSLFSDRSAGKGAVSVDGIGVRWRLGTLCFLRSPQGQSVYIGYMLLLYVLVLGWDLGLGDSRRSEGRTDIETDRH